MKYTEIIEPSFDQATNFTDEGKPCRKFKWVVEIEVDEIWVMDGFDLSEERIKTMILRDLSQARNNEVNCRVLKTPDPEEIRKTQGYGY